MPSVELFESSARQPTAALVFSRAARVALVGLVMPATITAIAASVGSPLPAWVRAILAGVPMLAFAASGAMAARRLGFDRRTATRLAFVFVVPGLTVSFAYGSLQGLSGREPVLVVGGVIVAMFALGFGAASASMATFLGRRTERRTDVELDRPRAVRAVAGFAGRGAAAGALGGVIALCPFLLAAARIPVPIPYVAEAITVAAFLGCIIVPYRLIGSALDGPSFFRSGP